MKLIFLLTLVGLVTGAATAQTTPTKTPDTEMAQATAAFLKTLSPDQQRKATYAFTNEERFNWYYTPRERNGLAIKAMSDPQHSAAMLLLKITLSQPGYAQAEAIMQLEVLLKELEGRAPSDDYRDPEKYYFTVFGNPSGKDPWGWRVDGHHLSLHFSSVTGKVASATPAFMGANPAIVPRGPQKGKQILKQEADLGFALLRSFSSDQLKKVVIQETAPNEIITGNARKAIMEHPEGIHYAEMTADQQQLLRQLLAVYVQKYQPGIAADLMRKVEQAGMDQLHFAWAGSPQPGDGNAHYYRIQSPVILIEYDNSQNNANHVHTVVRDLTNDFAEDALKKHYEFHRHDGGK